jgi:hypothetical protein
MLKVCWSWFKHCISDFPKWNEDLTFSHQSLIILVGTFSLRWGDFEIRARLGARDGETVTSEPESVLYETLWGAEHFLCGVEGVYRDVATITDIYTMPINTPK